MLKCNKCNITKPFTEFYKRADGKGTGYYLVCKLCKKAAHKQWYTENTEQHIKAVRDWQERNPDKVIDANRKYHETHKLDRIFQAKMYGEKNKKKISAHKAVAYAIRTGTLIRPLRCAVCRAFTKVQAHHDDYDKPLEVRWLCVTCHRRHHETHKDHNG